MIAPIRHGGKSERDNDGDTPLRRGWVSRLAFTSVCE